MKMAHSFYQYQIKYLRIQILSLHTLAFLEISWYNTLKYIGGEYMAANYNKLWKILIDRKLKRTDLRELAGISTTTVAKLGKDEYVSMECMDRICAALKCDIGDIMSFSHEER